MLPDPTRPIEYATKADLLLLEERLLRALSELQTEVAQQLHTQHRELSRTISELSKMIITTLLAMTAIFGTLVTVLKLFA
jgi:hypothetical protein